MKIEEIKGFPEKKKIGKWEFGPEGPDDNAVQAMNEEGIYIDGYNQALSEIGELEIPVKEIIEKAVEEGK
jgi:hypothetical protein